MDKQPNDNWQIEDMPSVFEELEVRRAMHKAHLETPDINAEWEKFSQSLDATEDVEAESLSHKSTHKRMWFCAIITSAAAILVALFILFPNVSPSSVEVFTANKNQQDIVMTTEEGKLTVVKPHQALAFDQMEKVQPKDKEKVKMLEISTPRGLDCQLKLPDGTRVWLNADSKITFPNHFVNKERNVKVEGEAYFEVTKDSKHPFVVCTDYFTTTVLGTVFNINAYTPKTASVVLVCGSVAVKPKQGNTQLITPGQMAKWNGQGNMNISDVDVYPLTQWKDGFFYFNNDRLIDIMMELGRWYNVSVVFEHEEDMNRRLHFVAEHKESLRDIIRRINELGVVKICMKKDHISVE